jgi:membrane-associated protease RseP (regulator of RpoE activity)
VPENKNEDQSSPNQRRVEFKFPLLTLRTKAFSDIFDRLGSFRLARYASWAAIVVVPIAAAVGLYLIVSSLVALLSNPAIGEITRELGPATILMLPGINPLLPIFYGWLAIVLAIAIHEGAHGIAARSAGFNVKSSGLLFFLVIPIGAFVDVDEEQIKRAKPTASLKVMAAGVGSNVAVAVVLLVGLLIVVGSLNPIVDGVYINSVSTGMPAQTAGILPNDVLISIDNVPVNKSADLRALLDRKAPGDTVAVTVARGERWQVRYSTDVNLSVSENRTIMGISVGDLALKARLSNYQGVSPEKLSMYLIPPTLAAGLVPFSDSLGRFYSSTLGDQWVLFANVFFWGWFVSFNLAIFNALPIYPLDGGRILHIAMKGIFGGRISERTLNVATYVITAACVTAVVLVTVIPFIP